MRIPSWRNRVNETFGFHADERVQQVHGDAVRVAYIAMAVATVPLGAYLQFGRQQPGAFWTSLVVLVLSLVVLGVRRVQFNGLGTGDERMVRQRQNVFAWGP